MTDRSQRRRTDAIRRLGGVIEKPVVHKCAHRTWRFADHCCNPGIRMRRDWDGCERWYCAQHDPLRIEAERRNHKKRLDDKKARWRAMEQERKTGDD